MIMMTRSEYSYYLRILMLIRLIRDKCVDHLIRLIRLMRTDGRRTAFRIRYCIYINKKKLKVVLHVHVHVATTRLRARTKYLVPRNKYFVDFEYGTGTFDTHVSGYSCTGQKTLIGHLFVQQEVLASSVSRWWRWLGRSTLPIWEVVCKGQGF